jgi:hypothetical protein
MCRVTRRSRRRGCQCTTSVMKLESCKILTGWLIVNSGPGERIEVGLPELDVKIQSKQTPKSALLCSRRDPAVKLQHPFTPHALLCVGIVESVPAGTA